MACSPPGSSVHGGSPGKNTGVTCHALLQGIFPTQGSTQVSLIAGGFFTNWATREAQEAHFRCSEDLLVCVACFPSYTGVREAGRNFCPALSSRVWTAAFLSSVPPAAVQGSQALNQGYRTWPYWGLVQQRLGFTFLHPSLPLMGHLLSF